MARPLLINGKLPMQIFKNREYRYAVTRTSVRKENGKYNHPQRIWGTIDDALNFTPNKRFQDLTQEELDNIYIPPEWHIVLPEEKKAVLGRPSYKGESSSFLYGHTWFLEMLAEQCGLRDDLEHVFEDKEKADQILSMAYFTILESSAYSHMESMQQICWFPYEEKLPPYEITRITQSITEAEKQTLFRCRRHRSGNGNWLGVDSTSFTCYGRNLADARRGKNKEHDPADQINVLAVYDLNDGKPVYYRKMPGNIPDTRTVRTTLQELKKDGFDNLCLVFDRGYVSEEVLEMLVKARCKFVMMGKNSDLQVKKTIKSLKANEMTRHENWLDRHDIYGKCFDYKFEVHVKGRKDPVNSMRLCLFFDPEWQGEKNKKLNTRVSEMEKQLANIVKDGQKLDDRQITAFKELFSLKLTQDNKIRNYTVKEDVISQNTAMSGYFSCITNCMSPSRHELSEILDIYGLRPEQEMAFMFIKSEQEGRRFRTSTEASTDGRLFVQFVALILNCAIYRKYISSDVLQKLFPSRKHMLDELRSIRLIRHTESAKIITEIVGKQVDIFREFKMPVPLHLLPAGVRKEYAQMLSENSH